jgi:hypothetical protein
VIPFASQRDDGQELAAHLANAFDNENVEIHEVRGAVARDLSGAFAEWEAQARALTRCQQELCSLSINPDEWQGRLTREQYLDYVERAEKMLGLEGQPRAIIFHHKQDRLGRMREHCHVVWSRVDAENRRAVPLSFFKVKLMTATREFARDHGLALPDGYRRHEEKEWHKNRQLSRYDSIKQKETGITHEERIAAITDAWKRSDSGRAFVNAVEELGYVLAVGDNGSRPVLVDIYGHTTALQRLIDVKDVRTRQIREFLGPDYAPEHLPTVDEAKAPAAQHRKAIDAFEKARTESEQGERLIADQAERRGKLEAEAATLARMQGKERSVLADAQLEARRALRAAYLADVRRIRASRALHRPTGLAAFLGKVTGVALITRKVQRYQDGRRFTAYRNRKDELAASQRGERQLLVRRQELEAADVRRRLRGLVAIEKKERESLALARTGNARRNFNRRHEHMPTFGLDLKPRGRKDAPHKAKNRYISPLARELAEAAKERPASRPVRLGEEFTRASRGESGEGDSSGTASGALQGAPAPQMEAPPTPDFDLTGEFRRAADPANSAGGDSGGPTGPRESGPENDGPTNAPPRPRRTRKRDLDRGR